MTLSWYLNVKKPKGILNIKIKRTRGHFSYISNSLEKIALTMIPNIIPNTELIIKYMLPQEIQKFESTLWLSSPKDKKRIGGIRMLNKLLDSKNSGSQTK